MIAAGALPTLQSGQARAELVDGTRDGERHVFDRAEDDGGPAKAQVIACEDGAGHEVYVRRAQPERCEVDGILAWHYDLDRGTTA